MAPPSFVETSRADPVAQVRDAGRIDCLNGLEPDARTAQTVKQACSAAEQDGREVDLHLVDQPGA